MEPDNIRLKGLCVDKKRIITDGIVFIVWIACAIYLGRAYIKFKYGG